MIITVDTASQLPPYVQIKRSVLDAIATRKLGPDDRLPPIRQLAGDLGVAPNTVARAYRELESEGVVASRGRRGTTVLAPPRSEVRSAAEVDIAATIRAARRGGLDSATILGIVTTTLATP